MDSRRLHNRKSLKVFRRELRNNLTPAEAVLWTYLQKKQLDARKFRRQHSIGNFIVDFYCHAEKLAIELDGEAHYTMEGSDSDEKRDAWMHAQGITVLRYENRDIFNNIEAVLEDIKNNFKQNAPPSRRGAKGGVV